MISRYVVFAVAILLTLSSTAPLAYGAATPSTAFLPASKIQVYGPRIQSITFSVVSAESQALADVTHGTPIQSWDLSFDAATWASFPSSDVGSTQSYSFDGIYFNMLMPVVNTTAFHQAIANLWNQTNFQDNVLGPAGTAGPALFPCIIFTASCDSAPSPYPLAPNYGAASKLLCEAGLTPTKNTTAVCDGTHFQSSTVWDYKGALFAPQWWWRQSLSRHYFSDWIVPNAAKIGLTFDLLGNGAIGGARTHVFDPTSASIIKPAEYVPGTPTSKCTTWGCPGYNTKPTFNYTFVYSQDTWGMYSYGYSASVDYVGNTEQMNSAFIPASGDATAFHTPQGDMLSNEVIYAKSAGAAAKANQAVATLQVNTLNMFNIYYENTLFAAYTTGWAGYAAIPTYGPDTSSGLGYTALNVYQTCYITAKVGQNTCPNGGNFLLGLADYPTTNGGFNPLSVATTVYDNDVWLNVYDTPLGTPPTGFTAPLKYMNWMTSSYSIKTIGAKKGAPFMTQSGSGWFAEQPQACTTCKIVSGFAITFNFMPNIYWSDHVPFTAYDYNFSLWITGVSGATTLPDLVTDYSGSWGGPAGLMATYINPATPLSITLYVNSSSIWAIPYSQIPLFPQHLLGAVDPSEATAMGVPSHPDYFNLDEISTAVGQLDTNLNPVAAVTCSGCSTQMNSKVPLKDWPAWLNNTMNLAVGTGPFILVSPATLTEENTGTGLMVMNPTYYRQFWQYYAYNSSDVFTKATTPTVTLKLPVYDWTYSTTLCKSAPDNVCKVGATTFGTGATWSVVATNGKTIESGTPTCAAGYCTLSIPTSTLGKGFVHVILDAPYTSFGLPRTWYQSYSFSLK